MKRSLEENKLFKILSLVSFMTNKDKEGWKKKPIENQLEINQLKKRADELQSEQFKYSEMTSLKYRKLNKTKLKRAKSNFLTNTQRNKDEFSNRV